MMDEVANVLARVSRLRDEHRHADWIEQYTSERTSWAALFQGRRGIQTLMALAPGDGWTGSHVQSRPVVQVSGEVAQSTTYSMYVMRSGDGSFQISSVVRFDDELARDEDGRWRFTSRVPTRMLPPVESTAAHD